MTYPHGKLKPRYPEHDELVGSGELGLSDEELGGWLRSDKRSEPSSAPNWRRRLLPAAMTLGVAAAAGTLYYFAGLLTVIALGAAVLFAAWGIWITNNTVDL